MILALVLSIFFSTAEAQNTPHEFWDAVLAKYEELCEASLKNDNAKEILNLKKALDDMLKHPVGKMDDEQTARFQAIQNKHAGISTPETPVNKIDTVVIVKTVPVETVKEVEHIIVTDTVTRIESISKLQIENIFSKKDTTVVMHIYTNNVDMQKASQKSKHSGLTKGESAGKEPRKHTLREKKEKKMLLFAGLDASVYPVFSFGGTVGLGTPAVGGYIKGRSSFTRITPAYQFDNTGEIRPGEYFWGDGTDAKSRSLLTIGAYFGVGKHLCINAGAGWGEYRLLMRDMTGQWAEFKGKSCSGIAFDFGIGYNLGRFRINAGVNNTAFSFFDFEIGVAYNIIDR